MKIVNTIIICFLLTSTCIAQQNRTTSSSNFTTGFKQIKEGSNFGLVFSGPSLNYGHKLVFTNRNHIIMVENEAGVTIPFSKGIPAYNIYLKPAEVSWLIRNEKTNRHFSAGPMLKLEYDYYLYPRLQSAFDYWFTNFSMGIHSSFGIPVANHSLIATLKFSLAGLTSRQPDYRNPYFYDIGVLHAVRHLNSGLQLSLPNSYNTTSFEINGGPNSKSRILWSYCFSYTGYFNKPFLSIMKHSIRLTLNKQNKK
jgi:hypothetical protein